MTLAFEKLLNREKGVESTWRTRPKIYEGQVSRETLGLETSSVDHSVSRTMRQKKLCLCPCRARNTVPLLATASPWGMEGTVGETDMAGGVSQVDQQPVS